MLGKAPFLISLMRSLRAEVVPIAQQDPQSAQGRRGKEGGGGVKNGENGDYGKRYYY